MNNKFPKLIKTYYKMYPALYTKSNYVSTNYNDTIIVESEFDDLDSAIKMAKETDVCLREENWVIYKYIKILSIFRLKIRIPLEKLYNHGFFKKKIMKDNFGTYYQWKKLK